MNKNTDVCSRPDYEAECKRLTDELRKLREEQHYMKELYAETQRELTAANAKLEMVYLFFGERR